MTNSKLNILNAILTLHFPNRVQMFNSRNTVGDRTKTIYLDGRIQVEYSAEYGYIEVLGATHEEFEELQKFHDGSSWDAMDKEIPTTVVVF